MQKITGAALLALASLSAQALTPGSGNWVKETATYGTPNLQNAYVFVPKNTAPAIKNGKRALMLTLHGCSMSAPNTVIGGFNWEDTAEKYGMVVVAPTAPNKLSNCWDWTGSSFSRTTRDAVPLKKLVDAVRNRPELEIDPAQIYVTGFSSGSVQSAVMSCAFPELFAAAGIASGPVLGSRDANLTVTAEQMVTYCKAANGNAYNDAFASQITSLVHGTADPNVAPTHTKRTQEGRALLYGGINLANCQKQSAPSGTSIDECADASGKPRLSKIIIDGLKHEWPAGGGTAPSGVNRNTINYPAYVTEWFFKNNLRIAAQSTIAPVTGLVATPYNYHIDLSWSAVPGAARYKVSRSGTVVGQPTTTSYRDEGLTSDMANQYCVQAVNLSGVESTPTCINASTLPSPCWSELYQEPCGIHYALKHLNLTQYQACVKKYGLTALVDLYGFGPDRNHPAQWTNYPDCRPLAF